MLTLLSRQRREIERRTSGYWYELAPGPDDGKYWAVDSAFFAGHEWESIAEPILADRLPGYDRHGRTWVATTHWHQPLDYVESVCERLSQADEAAMVYVLASELPAPLLHELSRGFPHKRDELIADLRTLSHWCRNTLRRWHSITVIGL